MIRGIKFISVPVANQDAALKFYIECLGSRFKLTRNSFRAASGGLNRPSPVQARGRPFSRPKDIKIVSVLFSPYHFGVMTCSRPQERSKNAA